MSLKPLKLFLLSGSVMPMWPFRAASSAQGEVQGEAPLDLSWLPQNSFEVPDGALGQAADGATRQALALALNDLKPPLRAEEQEFIGMLLKRGYSAKQIKEAIESNRDKEQQESKALTAAFTALQSPKALVDAIEAAKEKDPKNETDLKYLQALYANLETISRGPLVTELLAKAYMENFATAQSHAAAAAENLEGDNPRLMQILAYWALRKPDLMPKWKEAKTITEVANAPEKMSVCDVYKMTNSKDSLDLNKTPRDHHPTIQLAMGAILGFAYSDQGLYNSPQDLTRLAELCLSCLSTNLETIPPNQYKATIRLLYEETLMQLNYKGQQLVEAHPYTGQFEGSQQEEFLQKARHAVRTAHDKLGPSEDQAPIELWKMCAILFGIFCFYLMIGLFAPHDAPTEILDLSIVA